MKKEKATNKGRNKPKIQTEFFSMRISESEKIILNRIAKKHGKTASSIIRSWIKQESKKI